MSLTVPPPPAPAPAAPRWRRAARWAVTALAAAVVFVALLAPRRPDQWSAAAFLRIPVEALLGGAVLLAVPRRARGVLAAAAGAVLGVLAVLQLLDLGFWSVLNRQFDPLNDWGLLDDGLNVVTDSLGRAAALGAAAAAVLAAAGLVAGTAWAVRRLAGLAAAHRTGAARALGTAAVAWLALAALGVQVPPGVPAAAAAGADVVRERAGLLRAGLADRSAFAAAVAADRYRDTPGNQLLTALHRHDVVVAFVESYGRTALTDPGQTAVIGPALDDGERQLAARGMAARSGWLTSPTFGGYSWLAHATFQSGLPVTGQQRYRSLVATDRFTLTRAFARGGWDTVAVEPNNTYAWPEGDFYGYQRVHDSRDLGYRGPQFSWSRMPDQYALAAFQRKEYGVPGRGRLFAEVTLTSSHTPWTPVPELLPWSQVGDGSAYAGQTGGESAEAVWRDPAKVRAAYAGSVAYSVSSLVSWAATYGRDDLVLVFLGDHQPAPVVAGANASHDVPVTVVARDPAVLERVARWGWTPGLRPGPGAPVWPMEAFRDRFLTTFGPEGQPQ